MNTYAAFVPRIIAFSAPFCFPKCRWKVIFMIAEANKRFGVGLVGFFALRAKATCEALRDDAVNG